ETEHWDQMRNLLERFKRFSADSLSGRIRRNQIGKLRLEIDEFFVEAVVFAVANDRRSLFVVEPVVLANFLSQLLHLLCRQCFVLGHENTIQTGKSSAMSPSSFRARSMNPVAFTG